MKDKVKLTVIISIAAIVISCGLLAIPQFVVGTINTVKSISGYEFFFNLGGETYIKITKASGVSAQGIAALVIMALGLASYCFYKKSSALILLGGILNVTASILFFAMEGSKYSVYGGNHTFVSVGWTSYVIGALLVLTGLLSSYVAIRLFMKEKKQISEKQSYSYLKK